MSAQILPTDDQDAAAPLTSLRDRGPAALILDDNEFDRIRLSRMLRRALPDIDIRQAQDVDAFERELDQGEVDLVFIDYLLPGQDGLAALGKLRAHPDQSTATPIMLVGHGDHRVARLAMRGGCADYVEKSDLTPEALTRMLSETMVDRPAGLADEAAIAERLALRETVIRLIAALGLEIRDDAEQAGLGVRQCGSLASLV